MKRNLKSFALCCLLLCLTLCLGLFAAACKSDNDGGNNGDNTPTNTFTVTVMKDATTPAANVSVQMCAVDGPGTCLFAVATDSNGKAVIDYSPISAATKAHIALNNLPEGYVYADANGNAYDYEKNEGEEVQLSAKSHTITLKAVPNTPVTEVKFDTTAKTLATGEEFYLFVEEIKPVDATDKTLTWASSNPSVATIKKSEDGEGYWVTGVAAGTAKITATAKNGVKAECTVTVVKPGSTKEAPIAIGVADFNDGDVASLTAKVEAGKTVYYSYFNKGMITVDKYEVSSTNANAKLTYYVTDAGTEYPYNPTTEKASFVIEVAGNAIFGVTTADGTAADIAFTVALLHEEENKTIPVGTATQLEVTWKNGEYGVSSDNAKFNFTVEEEGTYKITITWTNEDDDVFVAKCSSDDAECEVVDQCEMFTTPYWIEFKLETAGTYSVILNTGLQEYETPTQTYTILIEKVQAEVAPEA